MEGACLPLVLDIINGMNLSDDKFRDKIHLPFFTGTAGDPFTNAMAAEQDSQHSMF